MKNAEIWWENQCFYHVDKLVIHVKKSTQQMEDIQSVVWIKWKNYFPSRFSPISTTFPAPIVINKSPSIQFSSKNFSISSKEGK